MLFFTRSSSGEKVYILNDQNYICGAKSTDFPLKQDDRVDKSISRNHATLCVDFDKQNSSLSIQDSYVVEPTVTCTDLSTYGTFVNEGIESRKGIQKKKSAVLKPGDRIRFGLQWNTFQLEFEKIVVLVTNDSELSSISKNLWILCGYTLSWWNYEIIPTHFTTNGIIVSPQLLCSLCHDIPIVTPAFWHKYLNAIKEKTALPKVEDYFPKIQDPQVKLEYFKFPETKRDKRKRLFQGKIFVFTFLEEYANYKEVVECAGGVASKWVCCKAPVSDISNQSQYVVIGGPENYLFDDESQKEKKKNLDKLKQLKTSFGDKKRFIPVDEISQAIFQCSIENFCNPQYSAATLFRPRQSKVPPKEEPDILVKDTQDITPPATPIAKENQIVVESCEEESELSESIITFSDQTSSETSLQKTKRPGSEMDETPATKIPRMQPQPVVSQDTYFQLAGTSLSQRNQNDWPEEEDEDPFEFDPATALCKSIRETPKENPVESNSEQREITAPKRARVESSSEEEDAGFDSDKSGGGDDGDNPFDFVETSFSKSSKRPRVAPTSPIRFFPPAAGPSNAVGNWQYEADSDGDDYDLDSNWIDTTSIKSEGGDESNGTGIRGSMSRMNLTNGTHNTNNSSSLSIIVPTHPGCQKVFRKTKHDCMMSIPSIISFSDMKKISCLSGKLIEGK